MGTIGRVLVLVEVGFVIVINKPLHEKEVFDLHTVEDSFVFGHGVLPCVNDALLACVEGDQPRAGTEDNIGVVDVATDVIKCFVVGGCRYIGNGGVHGGLEVSATGI